ncbi:MAG: hypothetical protein ABIF11_06975 [Nitrospirota bacterium]
MLGEVSNLSEEADKSKIDFLRGIRGGMLGKGLKGTWESLFCTLESKRRSLTQSKTESYKGKSKWRKAERQSEELIVAKRIGTT